MRKQLWSENTSLTNVTCMCGNKLSAHTVILLWFICSPIAKRKECIGALGSKYGTEKITATEPKWCVVV